MPKLAFLGDRHISQRHPRYQHALDCWDWALDDAYNHGATVFVGLGDVCEGWPNEEELYQIGLRYARLHYSSPSRLLAEVLGNHESPYALRFLGFLGISIAIDSFCLVHAPDVKVLLVPYPRRGRPPFDNLDDDGTIVGSMRAATERIRQEVQRALAITAPLPLIVAGHWTVAGMRTGASDYELHAGNETIVPTDVFDGVALTVTGHIHKAQEVTPTIISAGSLYRCSFSEVHDPKSYVLATVEDRDVRWERRHVPAREMVTVDLELDATSFDLATILQQAPTLADVTGKEVKATVRVQEEMLRAYDPSVFDPLRSHAALFQLERIVIPAQRMRAPELQQPAEDTDGAPRPLTLMQYVKAWLTATNQEIAADRLARLNTKLTDIPASQ